MKTKELIGWLVIWKNVLQKDSWDSVQEGMFREIIKRLEELEESKGIIEFAKMIKINLIKE